MRYNVNWPATAVRFFSFSFLSFIEGTTMLINPHILVTRICLITGENATHVT